MKSAMKAVTISQRWGKQTPAMKGSDLTEFKEATSTETTPKQTQKKLRLQHTGRADISKH
jgi:hypothetical protein